MSRFNDIETTAKIKLALILNPHIGGLEISVYTVNGIVFLGGFVQDNRQKNLADEIARFNGGIDIKNNVQVLSELILSNESSDQITQTTEAADSLIRDRVIGDLENDPRVNAYMINVDVAEGIVELGGIQANQWAYLRAEEIANHVEGVRGVVNNMEVRASA